MVKFDFRLMRFGGGGQDRRLHEQPVKEADAIRRQDGAAPHPKSHHPKYTVSDAFRMFARRTNGHGWGRIIRARSFRGTTIWFTLTTLAFAAGVVYTALLYANYAQYETGRRCFRAEHGAARWLLTRPGAPPRVGTAVASTDKYDFRSVCRNVYPLDGRQAAFPQCHCLLEQSHQSVQRNETSHFCLDLSYIHSLSRSLTPSPTRTARVC